MGHFLELLVMLGVLTVEALVQVGWIATLSKEENKGKLLSSLRLINVNLKD